MVYWDYKSLLIYWIEGLLKEGKKCMLLVNGIVINPLRERDMNILFGTRQKLSHDGRLKECV